MTTVVACDWRFVVIDVVVLLFSGHEWFSLDFGLSSRHLTTITGGTARNHAVLEFTFWWLYSRSKITPTTTAITTRTTTLAYILSFSLSWTAASVGDRAGNDGHITGIVRCRPYWAWVWGCDCMRVYLFIVRSSYFSKCPLQTEPVTPARNPPWRCYLDDNDDTKWNILLQWLWSSPHQRETREYTEV